MAESIKESCKLGVAAYAAQAREQWVLEWPGQVVLAVSAIFWTSAVTNALKNGIPGLLAGTCCCCHTTLCCRSALHQTPALPIVTRGLDATGYYVTTVSKRMHKA